MLFHPPPRLFAVICALLLGACTSPEPTEPTAPLGGAAGHIVNGQAEAGHPAVGALTLEVPGQYVGSFCTGTVIAPRWILTAAHCTEGIRAEGVPLVPSMVHFYIGTDARPTRDGGRPAGDYYQARAIHLHPQYDYDALLSLYDIALIELAQPVDVEPYVLHRTDPTPFEGDAIFYVGYGVSDGNRQTGGGVKRSTTMPLVRVFESVYSSQADGSGVCFGDSGGPGLVEIGGEWHVIGVNSTGSSEGVPCLGRATQTRVDAFHTWVRDTMGEAVDCNRFRGDACGCAAACRADGVCDAPSCGESCVEVRDCAFRCQDSDCFFTCLEAGSNNAAQLFLGMYECYEGCGFDEACMQRSCGGATRDCENEAVVVDPPDDGLSCEGFVDCYNDCPDQDCAVACYERTSAEGQRLFDALNACLGDCGDPDAPGYDDCIDDNCSDAFLACIPPDGCRVTGGDCDVGFACLPGRFGGTYCFESGDGQLGQRCDPDALSCEDGRYCVEDGAGDGTCVKVCTADRQCPGGPCTLSEATAEPFGLCLPCEDADSDGFCAEDDCDDGNARIRPGANEICADGADQDCDGRVDEGCEEPCADRDEDGVCAEEDCDDRDPAARPGAEERCGDGVDQDCDGRVDEGCDCEDSDGDGSCDADDCADDDPARRPGADEVCGDDVDQDCDGRADEGCDCADTDGDGACDDEDCADNDPGRRPGLDEVCGDGADQDCDGTVDEGCPVCVDVDGDAVCAPRDCADDDPDRFPGAAERCGDDVDDDCDDVADEGCDGCEDADGDGVCAGGDCDDADPAVGGPGPNGCGCEDDDGDGLCAEVDCDDGDPARGDGDCVVVVEGDAGVVVVGDGGPVDEGGGGGGGGRPIGCFCDVGGSGSDGAPTALVVMVALLGWRRRRVR